MHALLIQLKRIGDLILTTPSMVAIRQRWPDAVINLAVTSECADLIPALPAIDRALIMKRTTSDLQNYASVAKRKFDCCVDFTQNDRSAALTFLSQAAKRVAPGRAHRHRVRRWAYTDFVPNSVRHMHTIDYNFSLLEPLGIVGPPPRLQLNLPAAALESADHILAKENLHRPLVIFHPGSARTEKFWEPERWAAVIEHIRGTDRFDVALTGGGAAMERVHIDRIKGQLGKPIVDLSGKTDLLVLAAMIARARLLVTVDSAPMHFAAGLGTSQVVLFGPTNPFHWRPRETPAVILQGDSGEPVRHFTPDQPRVPMNLISTQAVIDGMNAMLSAPAAGA